MALNSTHPDYAAKLADWELMRDAYEGEGAVKAKGTVYLKPTPGQLLDGMDVDKPGRKNYEAYKDRAVFPDYVSDAVEMYIGLLHQKDATIELPAQMEALLDKATIDGESLQNLLRRINEQQLVTGRLGLLLDLPPNPDPANPLPYIALYVAESIRNWDNSNDHQGVNALSLVVLDESGAVRDADFNWSNEERYRVLQLLAPVVNAVEDTGDNTTPDPDVLDATEAPGTFVYKQGVFSMANGGTGYDPTAMITPMFRGKPLEQIPFVFINSKDIVPSPDNPPLLGLGRRCMSIYRGEADYRHSLFMQGQDTLVVIGSVLNKGDDDTMRVGAGASIEVDVGGDAKYIGVGADGLGEQRQSLENDRKIAEAKAGTLISPSAGKQESGDALHTRLAAQTASLTQIAQAGAAGLENILKIAAAWMGADASAVKVTPNLEFTPVLLTGQEVTQYMAARTMGAPLSLKSLHGVFVDRGLTKLSFEDELDQIAEEDADRAKRVAALPTPPAPPAAPAPGPGGRGAPSPAPAPSGARRPGGGAA